MKFTHHSEREFTPLNVTTANAKLLTTNELMARWTVSRTTIWRQVRDRKLKTVRVGGLVRFHLRDIEKYERESQ